jgi:hypothetical protein
MSAVVAICATEPALNEAEGAVILARRTTVSRGHTTEKIHSVFSAFGRPMRYTTQFDFKED